MKVLMIQQPGFDYLSSQLTEGLTALATGGIGFDVVQYPHIIFRTTQANPHHGARVEETKVVTTEEALDSLDWADLIIFSSCGNIGQWGSAEAIVLSDPIYKKKRVFVDGSDSSGCSVDPSTQLLYFKREMRLPHCNYQIYNNVRSLTFGSYNYWQDYWDYQSNLDIEWDKRDIDVSFVCFSGSNIMRPDCADVLKQIHGQKNTNAYVNVSNNSQPLSKLEYDDVLRRSKVAVSVTGAGVDTLRFWEIPAAGAILCSFDITRLLLHRNPYEAWRHCLYFSTWPDMVELIGMVVLNKALWCNMRKAADEHRKLHTTVHRAQELLTMCKEVL